MNISVLQAGRLLALSALAGLLLSLSLENWMSESLSVIRWGVQVIPLLLFFPALLKPGFRPYQWLCFVDLLYFLLGVLYLFTPERVIPGVAITCFSVLLFCAAIFYIHGKQREPGP
jgi:uncharacterized membrane protein